MTRYRMLDGTVIDTDIGMDLDDLPRRTDSMGHGVIYY